MKLEEVKKTIRDIYDFPQKGIIFRDLTTAFKDADALCTISEELKKRYEGLGVTKVVGIESRGFIGGAVLARFGRWLRACAQAWKTACRHYQQVVQQGVWCGHYRNPPRRYR